MSDVRPGEPAAGDRRRGPDGISGREQAVLDRLDRGWESLRSRWPGGPPPLTDVLVTVFAFLVSFPFAAQVAGRWGTLGGFFGLGIVVVFAAPFLWRRTLPLHATAAVVAAHVVQLAVLNEPSTANVTAPMITYSVARWVQSRRARRGVLVLSAAGGVLAAVDWLLPFTDLSSMSWEVMTGGLMVALLCFGAAFSAWLCGALVRQRAESLAQTREKAAAVERGRLQSVQLAAQEERARIAREMHDVVAHSLSVIVVQSDGASYALDSALERAAASGDPEVMAAALQSASAALTTIGTTARESLADTRRLVAVLRQDEGQAEYTPTGGVDSLEDLFEPLRGAGLVIDTDVSGRPRSLSRPSDLAVYRVVQEALTNVIKHAGDARVRVSLDYLEDGLLLTVRDDGKGVTTPPDGHGHGLIGMRERLGAVGGGLWAGGAPGGGFVVEARIPYDANARHATRDLGRHQMETP